MTTDTNTDDTTTEETSVTNTNPDTNTTDTDETTDDNGNAEAAKYRRRLRDTEAERDTLAGQLETMRRQHVEHLAATRLVEAADVWRGTELDDLLDADGRISDDKLDERLTEVIAERPHLARSRSPIPDMSQGARGVPAPTAEQAFAGAFGPGEQRLQ